MIISKSKAVVGRCHVETECIQSPPCGQLQPVFFHCRTSWSIATCVYDMVAYSKLNDSIIQLIKIYPNPKKVGVDLEEEDEDPNEEDPLREAKDLIERLEKRQLYTCIGETTPCKDMRWFKVNKTANVYACVCVRACMCVCVCTCMCTDSMLYIVE